MNGLVVHADCGAEVAEVAGQLFDRVMRRVGLGVDGMVAVEHRCRDYVAWHRSDRRDVWSVDVPGGWRPVRPGVGLVRAA